MGSGQAEFKCGGCGKTFYSEAHLRDHMKTSFCAAPNAYKKLDEQLNEIVKRERQFVNQMARGLFSDTVLEPAPPANFRDAFGPQYVYDLKEFSLKGKSGDPKFVTTEASLVQRIEDIERHAKRALEQMMGRIDSMQHTLAAANKEIEALKKRPPSFDPQRLRVPEKLDHSTWFSDEEDGLEVGYRGWPVPKDKVIF